MKMIALHELISGFSLAGIGPEKRADALGADELNRRVDDIARDVRLQGERLELVRALLLLWHDHLDASHDISQSIASCHGSAIHAMMHRREPDFWNSKYWWRKVGDDHPAFEMITANAKSLLAAHPLAEKILSGGSWSAPAFVDACEARADEKVLRELQRIEFGSFLNFFLSR